MLTRKQNDPQENTSASLPEEEKKETVHQQVLSYAQKTQDQALLQKVQRYTDADAYHQLAEWFRTGEVVEKRDLALAIRYYEQYVRHAVPVETLGPPIDLEAETTPFDLSELKTPYQFLSRIQPCVAELKAYMRELKRLSLTYFRLGELCVSSPQKENREKAAQYYALSLQVEKRDAVRFMGAAEEIALEQTQKEQAAAALFAQGNAYFVGKGVDKNWQFACDCYLRAAEQDYPSALLRLGKLYAKGLAGVLEKNEAVAAEYFERVKQTEDPALLFELGNYYWEGEYVGKKDIKEAIACYKKAAEGDHPYALLRLGQIFGEGYEQKQEEAVPLQVSNRSFGLLFGVHQNIEKSRAFYKRAQASTDPYVLFELGNRYRLGTHGVEKDPDVAFECYKKAADSWHVGAAHHLAIHYYLDEKSKICDAEKAVYYLEQAAEQGYPRAAYLVALPPNTKKEEKTAEKEAKRYAFFQQAVERKYPPALELQANLRALVGGVERTKEEEATLFARVMEVKWPTAVEVAHYDINKIVPLASIPAHQKIQKKEQELMALLSLVVNPDVTEEDFHHMLVSSEPKHLLHLGKLLYAQRQTLGEEKSLARARACYAQVQQSRDAPSLYGLGLLYAEGTAGVEVDAQIAFRCCEKAAYLGHLGAAYQLAFCYLTGRGVVRDAAKGIEIFEKTAAQKQHNPLPAQYLLAQAYIQCGVSSQEVEIGMDYLAQLLTAGYFPAVQLLRSLFVQAPKIVDPHMLRGGHITAQLKVMFWPKVIGASEYEIVMPCFLDTPSPVAVGEREEVAAAEQAASPPPRHLSVFDSFSSGAAWPGGACSRSACI